MSGQTVLIGRCCEVVYTFAFAAASPLGLRSAARLLVLVAVDDAGLRSVIGRRKSHNV
jgi:hypothetical protein